MMTKKEWKKRKKYRRLFNSKKFEETYFYPNDDLGVRYSSEKTCFKLWAPTAQKLTLCLYRDGEKGNPFQLYPMFRNNHGIWKRTIVQDLEGVYYTYRITVNGRTEETSDIYARACGVNGTRSMVIDLSKTNPQNWEEDGFKKRGKIEPIIYELHIKDFSSDMHSGVSEPHRGKYLAFTESKTTLDDQGDFPTCLEHIKNLGISYIHLLPTFDFASIDETKPLDDQFNWGYDPLNYNIPEGSYSTDAYDGHVRIKEFKQMIQAIHNAGIGVILDMVYNHTYHIDSAFQKTVPYYYYRLKKSGEWSNGSLCGNDTASERLMFRKFMVDSVCYWAKEYHIDGFRFDLMGLHDIETMNLIRSSLDQLPDGKTILMYGEPWRAADSPMKHSSVPALKKNIHLLDKRIAIFNDDTRDAIKGSVFIKEMPGYINGNPFLGDKIPSCVLAWCDKKGGYQPKNPKQILSYVSAHDNFTLWDKLLFTKNKLPDFSVREEDIVAQNRMAAGIVMTSLGIPFFQAGEEFARTKNGIGDSYHTESAINQLDWKRAKEFQDLTRYYAGLITIRRHFNALSSDKIEILEHFSFYETDPAKQIAFHVNGTKSPFDWWKELFVIYHNQNSADFVSLPEGEWHILCDGIQCNLKNPTSIQKTITVKEKGVIILGKQIY